MDTLRVDICYRPLRIAWAIRAGDFDAFRRAVRYSHAIWGGRFNPILIIDREQEASRLIDLFRVDLILLLGESDEVKAFPKKHSHLINPFFDDAIFMKDSKDYHPYALALDVHNALVHDASVPIPLDVIEHPGISYIARHGLNRHYSVDSGWDSPGFFVGSAENLDDLVCHWNLRACDIPVWFVDPVYLARYASLIPAWEKAMLEIRAEYRHEWDRQVAVWTCQEDRDEACKPFGDPKLLRCHVSDATWNGLNVRAPTMYFGEASVLGVVGGEGGKPKVSFALPEKPFCGDTWFDQQHLVASVSFIGDFYDDEQHTFHAPYVPEINELYARTMHFEYDKLRVEPERIGLVINVTDHDSFLYALPVGALMERIFFIAGYDAKLSSAGLIARQIIARLGGVQGARVFKVPGVRRLLKTHGPGASFTKRRPFRLSGLRTPTARTQSLATTNVCISSRGSWRKAQAGRCVWASR
jgi:hypothetical protein